MTGDSSREFRPDLAREFEYLLGHMPRVDRETFQGLVIESSEIADRVLEAENELFDAYVRGELPGEWRPVFEQRLLQTQAGRRKLALARGLVAKTRAQGTIRWIAAVLVAAAMIALAVWTFAR